MKNFFTVGIGRDPELISYCRPDLIITSNRVSIKEDIPIIALNDLIDDHPFLPIYDTAITEAIKNGNKEFEELVFKEIDKRAQGKKIIINLYYNVHTKKLREKGYFVTGPSDELVYEYSRKVIAYKVAQENGIPVSDGKIVNNLKEVEEFLIQQQDNNGIFVASDLNPFQPINTYVKAREDLSGLPENIKYLVTKWLPDCKNSPNSQVLIGPNKIFYLGSTDQIIKKNIKYYGNVYPSISSPEKQKEIKKYSLILARVMQKSGYRGVAGFDWIEILKGGIFFSEINPRKNRSSTMLINFLDHYRPKGSPSLVELEIQVSQGIDWDVDEWSAPHDVYWMMEVQRIYEKSKVINNILPKYSSNDIFNYPQKLKTSTLNFPPKGTILDPACPDIARIISVGKNYYEISQEIEKAKKEIADFLKKEKIS